MSGCREKALELLGHRAHFRRELQQKLAQRGFAEDEIEATLGEMSQLGLIDDLSQARQFASGPLTRKSFGPGRMRVELLRRGVEEDVVEIVVQEVFEDPAAELERAREAAGKRLGSRSVDHAQLARYLDRKGFSKGVILSLLEELPGG